MPVMNKLMADMCIIGGDEMLPLSYIYDRRVILHGDSFWYLTKPYSLKWVYGNTLQPFSVVSILYSAVHEIPNSCGWNNVFCQ